MRRCLQCGAVSEDRTCAGCGHAPAVIDGFDAYAPDVALQGPGYDPAFHLELERLEAGNFWFRARNALILDAFQRHAADARRYLEIGCGTGFVLGAVAQRHPRLACTGSELFIEGLGVAKRRLPTARLCQMDARAIPYQDEFDAIGAFDTLEHIEDDAGVLRECHRALRAGGTMLATVPQHPSLWSVQDDAAHHVRRYRRGELEDRMRAAGFEILYSTSFVSLLLPALYLSRRRMREAPTEHDPFAEFRIPRWMDVVLGAVMAVERMLLLAGIRLPAGGSRLVVARKAA